MHLDFFLELREEGECPVSHGLVRYCRKAVVRLEEDVVAN